VENLTREAFAVHASQHIRSPRHLAVHDRAVLPKQLAANALFSIHDHPEGTVLGGDKSLGIPLH
jgi:hypothetical protein